MQGCDLLNASAVLEKYWGSDFVQKQQGPPIYPFFCFIIPRDGGKKELGFYYPVVPAVWCI